MLSYLASFKIKDPVCPQPVQWGGCSCWACFLMSGKNLARRKGPLRHSVLQSQLTHPAWTKQPQRVKALLTLASGQVELLQRREGLSGPKYPGVGGSDLSAHSSAPSSAATGLLGGPWDSGLGSKPTYIFKDMCTVVESFVCLQI